MPLARSPAVTGVVFQGLGGTRIRQRSPRGARPSRRAMAVVTAVASMNTRRSGRVTGATGVECFTPGTRLRTPDGWRAVETLAPGDLVLTAAGRHARVAWVGHRRLDLTHHPRPDLVQPVQIVAGAFGRDEAGQPVPVRALVLSPGHGVLCPGAAGDVLIPAGELVNGRTVARLAWRSVEYWHVELDRHDVVLAEGLACESYLDIGNRADFAGGGSALALHPTFAALAHEGACAPYAVAGPAVDAVRARLARLARRAGRRLSWRRAG